MRPNTNIHSHTVFCDGADTAEEMVLSAINSGCTGIGFSAHTSLRWYDKDYLDWTMDDPVEPQYTAEILRLKEVYKKDIDIFLGIERDYFSDEPAYKDYDYVIGSVHGVLADELYISVDFIKEELLKSIDKYFDGDVYAVCEEYYKLVADIPNKMKADVIGHFDLISKFNENGDMFDENHPRYVKAWQDALDKLSGKGLIFEINTGAMSRGYRTAPYPSENMLRRMCQLGEKVIITSDSHSVKTITYGFDEAYELAKKCGYKTAMTLTKDGFKEVEI